MSEIWHHIFQIENLEDFEGKLSVPQEMSGVRV